MSPLKLTPLALCAVVLATACTTPVKTSPRLKESGFSAAEIEVAPDLEKKFVQAQNRMAIQTLAALVKAQSEPAPLMVAHDSALRVLGALLRASDGPTYTKLSQCLLIPEKDDLTYHVVLRRRLAALNHLDNYQHGAGIWMVWPVSPNSGYVNEMNKYLEVDVYRLGSARIGGRKELDRWAKVRDEAFPSPFASLGAQDAIIAASLARVQVGEAKSTSNPEIGVAEGGPDLQWVFSRMPLDDPTALPTGTETSYAVPWPEDTAILTDLEQNYKALGWDFLLGANDFRGINQELNRNSSLDGFKSVVVGDWQLSTGPRTFAYLIHKPTRAIIVTAYLPAR